MSDLNIYLHNTESLLPLGFSELFGVYLVEFAVDQKESTVQAFTRSLAESTWVKTILCTSCNKVVGFSILCNVYSSMDCKMSLELRDMYVMPHFRNRGIGTSMLAFASDKCPSWGIDSIFIYADARKIPFYNNLGWTTLDHVILKRNKLSEASAGDSALS